MHSAAESVRRCLRKMTAMKTRRCSCGYSLEGLPEGGALRCPECGIDVGSSKPDDEPLRPKELLGVVPWALLFLAACTGFLGQMETAGRRLPLATVIAASTSITLSIFVMTTSARERRLWTLGFWLVGNGILIGVCLFLSKMLETAGV